MTIAIEKKGKRKAEEVEAARQKATKKIVEESDASASEFSESESSEESEVESVEEVVDEEPVTGEEKDRRASREEQKRLREERKVHKPGQDILAKAKPIWAKACRCEMAEPERSKLLVQLFELLKGSWAEVAMKHDGSRIVQTCVKYGSAQQRASLAQELKGHFAEVAKSRYGKHIVNKLLLYCPDQREVIIGDFLGKLDKLLRHRDASEVVETIYRDYCNGKKRARMVREFYGPEYALFHQDEADLDELMKRNKEKGELILKNLETALSAHLQKGSTLKLSIVHRLLLDFLTHVSPARAQEWMPPMLEMLPEIIHTSEGSRAAIRCIALASAKERKVIVKAFKPFLARICADDRAYQVLIALLDLTDDTVLTGKSILSELKGQLDEVGKTLCGRRVLLYSIAGMSSHVLPPDVVKVLEEARTLAKEAGTTKKDTNAKQQELAANLKSDLCTMLVKNASISLTQSEWSTFVIETLVACEDPAVTLKECMDKLESPFANAVVCEMLKRLLKRTPESCSSLILSMMEEADLASLMETDAGFVLLGMLGHPAMVERIKKVSAIKKSKSKAAEAVRRKLE